MRDPHELFEGRMAAELEAQYLLEDKRQILTEVKAVGQFLRAGICRYTAPGNVFGYLIHA